ncbi:class I SAM-dependent methyltransferase [Anabaena cylindrica UHCC 0172]|uniref:class I SAM-dependent DNA methyltransferase n=1 Tax=Anabaena cylindrica TaxID=1165 RepID=UPI002B211FF1|nr:class I SAM-dependent methyltransferase [Anabaena cylindrica]MEA5552710.1 class I SAM-dependent methyltransferase [Anabaena cylindrica UHCC 0172]
MKSQIRYTDYDPWAWLYDESEAHLSSRRLLPKLKQLVLPHLPVEGQILDLCCGTGQLTQTLILKGYQLTGLDGSEKMLHYARKNAPNAKFILGDARLFELPNTFDAVICTDSALNHIMSLEELKSVFHNVYAAMKENTIFFFDLGLEKRYRNIPVNDGELQENYAWSVGETYNSETKTGTFTITVFQKKHGQLDKSSTLIDSILPQIKRLVYNKFLRFVKPSLLLPILANQWDHYNITFSVHPYSQAEIKSALSEIGFTNIKVYNYFGFASEKENKYGYFVAHKSKTLINE